MQTKMNFNLFLKSIKVFIIFVMLLSQFGWAVSNVSAEGDLPIGIVNVNVTPGNQWVQANEWSGWPLGTEITFKVNTSEPTIIPMGISPWGGTANVAFFELNNQSLQIGDTVTVSGGSTSVVVSIDGFRVTDVNAVTDTISGWATPGASIGVAAGSDWQSVVADTSGNWSANFPSHDIKPGDAGFALEYSNPSGYVIQYDWNATGPITQDLPIGIVNVNVTPGKQWVQANEWSGWPLGTGITFKVNASELTTIPMGTSPWGGTANVAFFELNNQSLQIGDTVTVSGGSTSVVVSIGGFRVTDVNSDTDTISGWATPGASVGVSAGSEWKSIIAESTGDWTANFQPYDIKPGDNGFALEYSNPSGYVIQYDWNVLSNPTPYFTARINGAIDGFQWSVEKPVVLSIDGVEIGTGVPYVLSQDPYFTIVNLDWPETGYTPGQEITLSNGDFTKTLIVKDMKIDIVDIENDIISGTAETGIQFYLSACNGDTCQYRSNISSDENGNWTVDFSQPGANPDEPALDVTVGMYGEIGEENDGDNDFTSFTWNIANSTFNIRANWDVIETWEWSNGEEITLTIDDPATTDQNPDYTSTHQIEWDSQDQHQSVFNLTGIYDVKPGDVVSLTNGTVTKTLTVSGLSITGFDLVADTVTGTAESGSSVDLVACDNNGNCTPRHLTTSSEGTWTGDFGTIGTQEDEQNTFDIMGTTWLDSHMCDADNDCTMYGENIPNPNFIVRANWDVIETWEWSNGEEITLTIDDPTTTDQNPDYSSTQQINWVSADQRQSNINLAGIFDIQPGDVVSLTNGTVTKTLTVSGLSITGFDLVADTVNGTAESGSSIDLYACDNNGCTPRHLTTSSEGTWTGDFGTVGTQEDEQNTFDLMGTTWLDSHLCDVDNDCTMFGENIPNPNFNVRANWDLIETWEWPNGEDVTLTIDDPTTTDQNPDYTSTQHIEWVSPDQKQSNFNFVGLFDIQPGDVVTLTDGLNTKTHTVTGLSFSDFDLNEDTVKGTAEPGSHVDIWACDANNCNYRHLATADDGTWIGDFGNIGTLDDEQTTFDLVGGTWIDSIQQDDDSDGTMYGTNIPNPRIDIAPYSDWIHAREWPIGTVITMTIDDPSNGAGVDYSETSTVEQNPNNPGDPNDFFANFGWPDLFTPGSGYIINMSGNNGQTKTYTIDLLKVIDFDKVNDTVIGIASPNAEVQVCANSSDHCVFRYVIANNSGEWTADFQHPGSREDEQETLDLQPGMNGWAAVYDQFNNDVWFDWNLPNPWFSARLNGTIDAWQWEVGKPVKLYINGSYIEEQSPIQTTPDWTDTTFNYQLGSYNFGDEINLTNGEYTKSLVIADFKIDQVDIKNDIISGTAASGVQFLIAACYGDSCQYRFNLASDENGNWSVDFKNPGANPGEPSIDLVPGMYGEIAEMNEADGDFTSYTWSVPEQSLLNISVKDENGNPIKADVFITPVDTFNPQKVGTTGISENNPLQVNEPPGKYHIYAVDYEAPGYFFDYGEITVPDDGSPQNVEMSAQNGFETLTVNLVDFETLDTCIWFAGFKESCIPVVDQQVVNWVYPIGQTLHPMLQIQMNDGDYQWYYTMNTIVERTYEGTNPIHQTSVRFGHQLSVVPDVSGAPTQFGQDGLIWEHITDQFGNVMEWINNFTGPNNSDYQPMIPDYTVKDSSSTPVIVSGTPSERPSGIWTNYHIAVPENGPVGDWTVTVKIKVGPLNAESGEISGTSTFTIKHDSDLDGLDDTVDNAPNTNNPDQRDIDQDGKADVIDPCPSDATNTCNESGSISISVSPEGGTLIPPNEAIAVQLPAGSLAETTSMSITDKGSGYAVTTDQGQVVSISSADIGPAGTHFVTPITITFNWLDADNDGIVDSTTINEDDLIISKDGVVIAGPCKTSTSCDKEFNKFSIQVSSLSYFVLGDSITPPLADAGPDRTANEGDTLDFNAVTPTNGEVLIYTWDLDNDGQYDDGAGITAQKQFIDNGTYTVGLLVTDKYGVSSKDSTLISVSNVSPVITSISAPISPVQLGLFVITSAEFIDPGDVDSYTAVWSWDDGSTSNGMIIDHTVSGQHNYSSPGVYNVKLLVVDDDGGTGYATSQYVVIYDPDGGFVTGGGWINSPSGAYIQDPSMVGKATFGFTSKYKKGASVPTGNTEFHFQTANFKFSSISYDWLVVAGSKAQFKGKGTINGSGNYGFMLTAVDGQPDRFRIKIWNISNNSIIYDNMLGTTDDSNQVTALGGGSIVIHK